MTETQTVKRVTSPDVAEIPTATWSNCLVLGNEILLSGMTAHPAIRPDGTVLDAYEQTCVVLNKIKALVEASGGGLHNVYRLIVYVTNIADKDAVGRARREFFREPYPCSSLVEVSGLVFPGLNVEIEAHARLDLDMYAAGPALNP